MKHAHVALWYGSFVENKKTRETSRTPIEPDSEERRYGLPFQQK